MQSTPDRRLAAIVFTDIAGFTALSAEDEEKALSLIDQQRDLLKPIVEQFNGKWLKEMGDGLLLSFISTKQAVNCAIEIQKATKSIEGLNLRIGVHQGDILEKEGDVFGDDVNIASRIEPFAAVGGVAISGKINDDISGSPEITTKFVGIPRLKGVSQEVKIYCITSHGLPETDITKITAKLEKDVKRLWFNQKFIIAAIVFLFIAVGSLFIFFPFEKEVPSVGILYMDNRGSEEDEFWAQGITEDVIIEVASAGLIRVAPMKEILEFVNSNLPLIEIAGKLRVEYLLTSSIYKKVDGFDLRAQLIEVKSGKSIYANKWSESLDKSSTIIGTLADNILKSLGVLTKLNITKHYTVNPEAYEFYLKGKYRYDKRENMEDTEIARGLFRKAIELDAKLVKARVKLGNTYVVTGDYEVALKIFEESIDIAEATENQTGKGSALVNIGIIHDNRGDYDEALKFYGQSLEISRVLGDCKMEGSTLNNIGNIHNSRSDYDEALKYYGESLEISRELSDRRMEGNTLNNIGIIHSVRSDNDEALKFFGQSLEIGRELGELRWIGMTLMNIGIIHSIRSDYNEALKFYRQSLEIGRELGERMWEGVVLNNIGTIHDDLGDYDEALNFYRQSLEICHELSNRWLEKSILNNTGTIHLNGGEYDKAFKFYEQSLEISLELSDRAGEGKSMHAFGNLYREIDEYDESVKHLLQAIDIFREIGAKQNVPVVQADLALAMIKKGDGPQEILSHAVEAEKGLSVVEQGKIKTLWSLATVYQKLRNIESSLNIEGLTVEDCGSKYRDFLEQAHREVMDQAKKIQFKKYRESFLTNVRENREVVAAWEEINQN